MRTWAISVVRFRGNLPWLRDYQWRLQLCAGLGGTLCMIQNTSAMTSSSASEDDRLSHGSCHWFVIQDLNFS
jgi:hypothetical protein